MSLLYLGREGDAGDRRPPDGRVIANVWLDLANRHHPGSTLTNRVMPQCRADGSFAGCEAIEGRIGGATGRSTCFVPAGRVSLGEGQNSIAATAH